MVKFIGLYFIPLKSLNLGSKKKVVCLRKNFSLKKNSTSINLFRKSIFKLENTKKVEMGFKNLFYILVAGLTAIFGVFFFSSIKSNKETFVSPVLSHSFSKKPVMTKIKTIPVFSVTNRFGQPFLIQNNEGEHVGLIFLSHFEALEFGKELEKSHQATNPRIFIMGLDKAMKMVSQGATSSGIKDRFGQDIKMRFQFIPEQRQVDYSISLNKTLGSPQKRPNVPVFTVPGLNIMKGKERISPMFLSKEDLDLAWKNLRNNNPDFDRRPEIIEADLIQLIFYMKNNGNTLNSLLNIGFVPSNDSLAFVKKEIKTEPSARMIF